MTVLTAPPTPRTLVRSVLLAWIGSVVLLQAELFLTADSTSPSTWAGVVSDTAIVLSAGLLALVLAALSGRAPRGAGVSAFAAALLFCLPFWAGGAVVLGVTAYLLNARDRRPLALAGLALAALQATYLVVSIGVDLAPGLPG